MEYRTCVGFFLFTACFLDDGLAAAAWTLLWAETLATDEVVWVTLILVAEAETLAGAAEVFWVTLLVEAETLAETLVAADFSTLRVLVGGPLGMITA